MWSFEDLNVKENSVFRRHFTCEFDSGMERVCEVKFCVGVTQWETMSSIIISFITVVCVG